jgi:predicted MFS family arabinose efflux permease
MIKTPFSALTPDSNLSLCLISFIATISLWPLMIMPVLLGAYIDHLGFEESAAGFISSANLAGIAIITLFISLRTKRWPLHRIAAIGMATMIAFDIATLYFQSLNTFTLLRFLSGLASGAAGAATVAAIARLHKPEKGYGIYIAFQFILPAIGIYALAETLPSLGFNGMMQIIIAIEIMALLVTPVFFQYSFNKKPLSDHGEIDRVENAIILQRPALLSLLGLCIYGTATSAIWAYADRMGLNAGWSLYETGNILSIITAISIVGAAAVIYLGDRYGHLKPLSLGIGLQVLGLLILMLMQNPIGYSLGVCLFSMAWAFSWPFFLSIQASLDHTGTVVVAGQFTNLVGNSIGPAMAALLVGSGIYASTIWMAIALSVLSLCLMLLIPFTQNQFKQPLS